MCVYLYLCIFVYMYKKINLPGEEGAILGEREGGEGERERDGELLGSGLREKCS